MDNGFLMMDTAKNAPNYMGFQLPLCRKEPEVCVAQGSNEETTVSVNLNNIAKAFLTSYM